MGVLHCQGHKVDKFTRIYILCISSLNMLSSYNSAEAELDVRLIM